ncbi:MAG TPA: PKD domain-containing protein, partial [Oligoflexia bacterium]|nr:PKD domain-containing protein [Oligoflexia bacterium]HMP47903.1 PKD domain-containing protein [Oligoflexia bacterium]
MTLKISRNSFCLLFYFILFYSFQANAQFNDFELGSKKPWTSNPVELCPAANVPDSFTFPSYENKGNGLPGSPFGRNCLYQTPVNGQAILSTTKIRPLVTRFTVTWVPGVLSGFPTAGRWVWLGSGPNGYKSIIKRGNPNIVAGPDSLNISRGLIVPAPGAQCGQFESSDLSKCEFILTPFSNFPMSEGFHEAEIEFTAFEESGGIKFERTSGIFDVGIEVVRNFPPKAKILATKVSGLTYMLDATASEDDTGILEYQWDAGASLFGNNFLSSNPIFTVTYPSPGEYLIRLSVLDDDGAIDIVEEIIQVGDGDDEGGSSNSPDSDGDGVSDSQELIDGTNPNDPGSFLLKLPKKWCSEWNGFLGMFN